MIWGHVNTLAFALQGGTHAHRVGIRRCKATLDTTYALGLKSLPNHIECVRVDSLISIAHELSLELQAGLCDLCGIRHGGLETVEHCISTWKGTYCCAGGESSADEGIQGRTGWGCVGHLIIKQVELGGR